MSSLPPVAFFRLEGVLVRRSARACAAWIAARQQRMSRRLLSFGAIAASAPMSLPLGDPEQSTRWLWRTLEGCTEDRLEVLGQDWWRDQVLTHWNIAGLDLVKRCQDQGMHIVILSDQPRAAVGPVKDALGADVLICNALERRHGTLTGRLISPVFSGYADSAWLKSVATEHGFSSDQLFAYGSSGSDATMLSGVQRPCTVTPDRALRRLATTFDWPIVES
jgi:phosphoserine phosphatase